MRLILPLAASAMAIGAALLLRGAFEPPQAEKAASTSPAVKPEAPRAIMDGKRLRFPAQAQVVNAGQELKRPLKSLLRIDRPMNYGDWHWDDSNVPAGDLWVRIDLSAQTMSVFRAGHEIGSAVILYGAPEKPSPTGEFKILQRIKNHHSDRYDAPMPFTLRLTWDGIAIHASDVRDGKATHGCIGLPAAFAERLFDQAALGDEVTIT